MSDSISSGDKSPAKSSASKSKDSGSSDSSGESSTSKSDGGGGDGAKSARESVGGAKDIHYGFFSSVRNPAYRSGWDDVWGKHDKKAKKRSRATIAKAKSKAGAKPVTAALKIEDLPAEIRDGLVDAARKKMRRSRASFDKLDASGVVDWAISVTLNGERR